MRHLDRLLIGIILIIGAFACLWWGSPARTGTFEPQVGLTYLYLVLFAVGFIFVAVGLMGGEHDYSSLMSGLVLYFMIGLLIAAILYVRREGQWSLAEADNPAFWTQWLRIAATWPLQLVKLTGILGYRL